VKEKEGWAYLMNSRSEHYFVGGRSLCRKWIGLGIDYGRNMNQPPCKACEKALKKREAKMSLYPNECSRCGFCCVTTPCPEAIAAIPGTKKGETCPALEIGEKEQATCLLFQSRVASGLEDLKSIKRTFGIGAGCCIKATAMKTDESGSVVCSNDFSGLSNEVKRYVSVKSYKDKNAKTA